MERKLESNEVESLGEESEEAAAYESKPRRATRPQQRFARKASGEMPREKPVETAHRGFSGNGQEVPHRQEMEASFGTSLSHVRAFTDGSAREASKDLRAHAYTLGNQIAFRDPNPSPALVAHELTHTFQHANAPATKSTGGEVDTSGEHEADTVEAAVRSGLPASSVLTTTSSGGGGPARSADDYGPALSLGPALDEDGPPEPANLKKSPINLGLEKEPGGFKAKFGQDIKAAGVEVNVPVAPFFFLKGALGAEWSGGGKFPVEEDKPAEQNGAAEKETEKGGFEAEFQLKASLAALFGIPWLASSEAGAQASAKANLAFQPYKKDGKWTWDGKAVGDLSGNLYCQFSLLGFLSFTLKTSDFQVLKFELARQDGKWERHWGAGDDIKKLADKLKKADDKVPKDKAKQEKMKDLLNGKDAGAQMGNKVKELGNGGGIDALDQTLDAVVHAAQLAQQLRDNLPPASAVYGIPGIKVHDQIG